MPLLNLIDKSWKQNLKLPDRPQGLTGVLEYFSIYWHMPLKLNFDQVCLKSNPLQHSMILKSS